MNTSELIARVRRTVYMGDAAQAPEYTDAVILEECDDKLTGTFLDLVLKSRPTGYWLQRAIVTATVARITYRIPPRACLQGLEKVEMSGDGGNSFYQLRPLLINQQQEYQSQSPGSNPGLYMIAADQVEITPPPSAAAPLKLSYYITPSKLVMPQSEGRITDISSLQSARQVTVNALPIDMLPAGVAIATGSVVDVVHPDGTHELALVNATVTVAGTVLTFGGSDDVTRIEEGDYVRVAKQTEWAPLADEFHRALADVTAVKICFELGIGDKVSGDTIESIRADLASFRSAITPRVKADPVTTPISPKSRDVGWGGYGGVY